MVIMNEEKFNRFLNEIPRLRDGQKQALYNELQRQIKQPGSCSSILDQAEIEMLSEVFNASQKTN